MMATFFQLRNHRCASGIYRVPFCEEIELMLGARQDECGALLTAPLVVISEGQRHLGLVRDLSLTGMFFYTDFEPACGSGVELNIRLTKDGSRILACQGDVVRVVHGLAGSAVGVAVQVTEYQLQQTSTQT
jgi:hypothetical protein